MVASEHLVRERHGARERAVGRNLAPFVIQLAGCEARWMAEGARIAEELGADIIDINMGCPAREVTGKLSGSALMRDLDHAARLIEAVVGAVGVPVTLKMRLGWDRREPQRAGAGAARRGRRRGADHRARAHALPVLQGQRRLGLRAPREGGRAHPRRRQRRHRRSRERAKPRSTASGADGVMVGRGAYGAPWMPARIAAALASGRDPGPPPLAEQGAIAGAHVEAMLAHYGRGIGLRNARKHIGWYLASSGRPADAVKAWRRRLCTSEDAGEVLGGLAAFYDEAQEMAA